MYLEIKIKEGFFEKIREEKKSLVSIFYLTLYFKNCAIMPINDRIIIKW